MVCRSFVMFKFFFLVVLSRIIVNVLFILLNLLVIIISFLFRVNFLNLFIISLESKFLLVGLILVRVYFIVCGGSFKNFVCSFLIRVSGSIL